jgi:hypothetical protein
MRWRQSPKVHGIGETSSPPTSFHLTKAWGRILKRRPQANRQEAATAGRSPERTYAIERAAHARAAAVAKGIRIGRPSVIDPAKLAYAAHLRDQENQSISEIVEATGITRSPVHRRRRPSRPSRTAKSPEHRWRFLQATSDRMTVGARDFRQNDGWRPRRRTFPCQESSAQAP